jgi:hypothetical protein
LLGIVDATALSGGFRYDDELVPTVFPDVSAENVHALSRDSGVRIDGTVDLATDSYAISGLDAGVYFINVALERTPPADQEGNAGDLRTQETLEVTNARGGRQLDMGLRYIYRLISPADSSSSVLSGSGWDCNDYPAFAYPITVAIDPVPLAIEYTLNVNQAECAFASLGLIETTSSSTSFELAWGSAGEDYQGMLPARPDELLNATGKDVALMAGLEDGAAFRTNLGLCEIWGESATVQVIVSDESMSELGRRTYQLRPYENLQVNQVASVIGGVGTVTRGIVELTATDGNGKVAAYLSVVDNATGDPTFIAFAPQAPAGS